jgi:nucleotide-binding universal stress UspA family protein
MAEEAILVLLDGSVHAEAALPYAVAVATATHASLKLLSVVEPLGDLLTQRSVTETDAAQDRLRSEGQPLSQPKAHGAPSAAPGDPYRGGTGYPSEEILRVVEAEPPAMIVMATHGRSGFHLWVLGGVADKVMQLASVPTLLMRPLDPRTIDQPEVVRHLLVPLDGSMFAEAALGPAVRRAGATGAALSPVCARAPTTPAGRFKSSRPFAAALEAGVARQDFNSQPGTRYRHRGPR